MSDVHISVLELVPAPAGLKCSGLMAFAKVIVGEVVIDGLAVRRTTAGTLAVSWPERRGGRRIVSPATGGTRARVEAAVLQQLARQCRLGGLEQERETSESAQIGSGSVSQRDGRQQP